MSLSQNAFQHHICTPTTNEPPSFEGIMAPVKNEFEAVNRIILDQLHTNVPFVRTVGEYLIKNGGKRLRPLVALLCSKALEYQGETHLTIATIVEFLHAATLLHDDVVDESRLRRGKPSANAVWGNAASVLVGDFLISRAFQMIVGTHDIRVMSTLSDATNLIAEGEVLQLLNCKNPATTEEQYRRVIYCKTAKMFEVSTQIGAMIAKVDAHKENSMRDYGKHLGMAFQIQDDILDYTGDTETLGKNIGDDFAEGKVTLPVIYALAHAQPIEQEYLKQAILSGNIESIEKVIFLLQRTGAIEYCQKVAATEAEQAKNHLNCLTPSIYRDALEQLTEFALLRKS